MDILVDDCQVQGELGHISMFTMGNLNDASGSSASMGSSWVWATSSKGKHVYGCQIKGKFGYVKRLLR
ncbi:hypothetical protein Y032_0361g3469 [Ancylostoma ceylanicum]|uniref:Uncharacterized protein n=1 Tax=Ancylostoma ceylanicum TaxID=53326 RepID=A0A016RW66_9BILA|nr:hypothetical protein Y032_0361g3469 [Ancylostoma ceylanicum]